MAYGNQPPPPPGQAPPPPPGQAPPPGYGGQMGKYPPGEKTKVVYGILAILLGWLGIHKFYIGQTKQGIIYLLLGCIGIGGILGLVTGILALIKSDEEFYQKYIVEESFI